MRELPTIQEPVSVLKLFASLREMRFEVRVPEEIAQRARTPIERMVAIG